LAAGATVGGALATAVGARLGGGGARAGTAPAGNSSCWPGLTLEPWRRPLASISAEIDTP
jgi:hypothetical protein